ncbi:MAG: fumarylacetoacetase [Bacteroidales bacterium]|nr:fumarylacetoacetase [Bacteroidales bacterium]HOI33120.1 fumarylacetoacetase [Bacteroidales bacterium]
MLESNNPELSSWIEVPENSDFPIQNLPYGIATSGDLVFMATRIGNTVIDLSVLADFGYFDGIDIPDLSVFYEKSLNQLAALPKKTRIALRERLSEIFSMSNTELQTNEEVCQLALYQAEKIKMLMPVQVGDYTDFYSSIEHATNVGKMFRDPDKALLPNWKHLPVGYHGRASSIVVSGTSIHRPKGQTKPNDVESPVFGPSKQVDFELEMAFITSAHTALGDSIAVDRAEEAIFGLVVFNDLSARDIQRWEYVPLGPFLSKSFGSVISPWVITMEALEPYRTKGPKQEPEVLPYLQIAGEHNFDIQLEVAIQPQNAEPTKVCQSNSRYLYWNMAQQLAHQTVAGCNLNPGDMYASGTISGPTPDSFGSMLELSWKGTQPIKMKDGSERTFLLDHDTIIMRAFAERNGIRIGFGDCITTILPAK